LRRRNYENCAKTIYIFIVITRRIRILEDRYSADVMRNSAAGRIWLGLVTFRNIPSEYTSGLSCTAALHTPPGFAFAFALDFEFNLMVKILSIVYTAPLDHAIINYLQRLVWNVRNDSRRYPVDPLPRQLQAQVHGYLSSEQSSEFQ
jgi:hypothetical protein